MIAGVRKSPEWGAPGLRRRQAWGRRRGTVGRKEGERKSKAGALAFAGAPEADEN
jgi:hypothetical protein